MIFSKTWKYAVRALIYLAEHPEEGPILSSTIAKKEKIPEPFLVKILGTLASAGLVNSIRGRNGGFQIEIAPGNITLMDIAKLFDFFQDKGKCLLGYGFCEDDRACPVHHFWAEPESHIKSFLNNTTIKDLCGAITKDQNQKELLETKEISAQ